MDPMVEEQLDYGDDDFVPAASKPHHFTAGSAAGAGAIPALADDDMMGDEDDFDDLYNDVNVGEHFTQHSTLHQNPNPTPVPIPFAQNGNVPAAVTAAAAPEQPKSEPSVIVAPQQNPNFANSRVQEYSQENNHAGDLGFQRGSVPQIPAKVAPAPVPRPAVGPVDPNGPTMLFVGELHWWTTDADLESALIQYGRVKEIKFFDERASGKSKGYCQVEFYDAEAAAACKEGMDGYEFNGKACVVAFASPQTMRQMGVQYANRNAGQGQSQPQQQQGRRQMNDGMGRGGGDFGGGRTFGGDGGGGGGGRNFGVDGGGGGRNFGADGGGGRNFGRGGWGGGRGGQGMMNRGQGGGGRGRGFGGGRGMMGAGGGVGNNGPYGQGLGGPAALSGLAGMMHQQNMMAAGFDPTYMARGGPYGGFSGPAFTGMMPPFQAVNAVGLPGVAPHVNPAFFGRGMTVNGMGVMGGGGMEGQMWGESGMGGGWSGEEHGRSKEPSYGGDDGASDYGYGEVNPERGGGGRSNASREKERGPDRDWSGGNSDRRHRDDQEQDVDRSDRERHREEKDGHREHRSRDRDYDNEADWDRGQSSSRSRSKYTQEDDHRSRSRDADYGRDYGKRRRE